MGQHRQIKNNLIQQYQGASYRYDAQGNVVEKQHQGQSLKLHWDNLNRLASSELNGQTTHYGYDVFGRRLFKQTQRDLTLFGWDGDLMIWESVKRNNNSQSYTKHYLYEPDGFVPLVQTGYSGFIKLLDTPDYRQYQTQAYVQDQDPFWKTDTRYKRAEIERAVFYHCDQVGTPQVLSNESGEQVWAVTLDTWGQALEIKASNNLLEQTNIRFQGQYYDQETGLHYNRYRYYSPYVGRFISKDPIGLLGGFNIYAYAPNPIQWTDALGLKSEWQKNWEVVHGKLPEGYQVHHIIPKSTSSVSAAKKLCTNFDVHNVENLIALPKDSNVAQKTGASFGKTTHSGYHAGYSAAAEASMAVASRLKSGVSGCKRLAVIQAGLKAQLQKGGQTMYGNQHTGGTGGVERDWKSTVRSHVRGG